ncbi:MAG: hypothetical protein HC904_04820 [Blastochloris sp.]|nr:hypothetical protein [Blastochloris sp.]
MVLAAGAAVLVGVVGPMLREIIAGASAPPPVSAAATFQSTLGGASTLRVYEGLPHPLFERELMQREEARLDVVRLGGFPFYSPAIPARLPDELRTGLADPASLRPFGGEKLCGGFHPDYAVAWPGPKGEQTVLICFGCKEIQWLEEGRMLRYDLTPEALAVLKRALAPHAVQRPRPVHKQGTAESPLG